MNPDIELLSVQTSRSRWENATYRPRFDYAKAITYTLLILMALIMLLPFVWMLSASLKFDKDVFAFPIQWIPRNPVWSNYLSIWTQIPFLTFFANTFKLTIIIT